MGTETETETETETGLIGQMSSLVKGSLERFFYWWGALVTRHPYKDATFLLVSKIYSNYIWNWQSMIAEDLVGSFPEGPFCPCIPNAVIWSNSTPSL